MFILYHAIYEIAQKQPYKILYINLTNISNA